MAIILSNYVIPEKGKVNIDFNVSFEIKCTAVQAKRTVNNWLLNEISYLIGADLPTLILQQQPAWRVPVWLTLSGTKHKEIIGYVDVDVETGQIIDPANSKIKIEQYLQQDDGLTTTTDKSFIRELPPNYVTNLTPPPQIINQ
ncbi:MAG TPA: hypothetical protein ENK32_03340 [Anaerolineae bacterium]|nr:hypothetical protein [Anaerolineae bacterium]